MSYTKEQFTSAFNAFANKGMGIKKPSIASSKALMSENDWEFLWIPSAWSFTSPSAIKEIISTKIKGLLTPEKGAIAKLKKIQANKKLAENVKKKLLKELISKLGVPKSVLNTLDCDAFLTEYYALDKDGFSKGLSSGSWLAKIPGDPFGVKAFEDAKAEYLERKVNFNTTIHLNGSILATATTTSPDKDALIAAPSGTLKKHILAGSSYSFQF
jgi:hypothetical protein